MKPNPDTLLSKAEGTIPEDAFTGEKRGLFTKTYLSGASVYDLLADDETIHYLLVNRSDGLTIETMATEETKPVTPGSGFRAVAAVTDQRLFFAIGEENGDTFIELDASDITDATLQSGLLYTKTIFETETERYTFGIKKRESSDPGDAVTYVQEHLVPRSAGTDSEPTDDPPATVPDEETDTAGPSEETSTEVPDGPEQPVSEFESDGPAAAFVSDPETISTEVRQHVRDAAETIRATDTSEDNLNDAIGALETAKEQLQQVADEPGVETEAVDEAIDRLDSELTALTEIRSTYAAVKRNLTLSDNGMQVSESTFDELRSSVAEAIETAQELGRSSATLEEYQERVEAKIDSTDPRPSTNGGRADTPTGTKSTGTPSVQESEAADDDSDEAEATSEAKSTDEDSGPSREDLLSELQWVKSRVGQTPTPRHVRKYAKYNGSTFVKEFGTWEKTFEAAFSDDEEPDESTDTTPGVDREDETDPDSTEEDDPDPVATAAPTCEDIIDEIERVSQEIGKRPSTGAFDAHSEYSYSDAYDHFGSWEDAIDAASIETASPRDLLDELHRLEDELGFPPNSTYVDEHSTFTTHDYRQEFGSVSNALEEAGIRLEPYVRETLEQLVAEADGKPTLSDFEEALPYSSGIIYNYFDSWDDAVNSVTPEETPDIDDPAPEHTTGVEQNELSERYELLRNLRALCTTVVDARGEYLDDDGSTEPMTEWVAAIESRWEGDDAGTSYGAQQNERNPFPMSAYREAFGDGDRVTEFEHAGARPPQPSVQALLEPFLDTDPSEFHLPVDAETGATFPIIVESRDELRRATEMLQRLPAEPPAAPGTGNDGGGEDDDPVPVDETALLDVNGVTEEIAASLQAAGYRTRDDLREASMDELAAVDGVGDQVAMRIKLDVGE